MSYSLSEHFRGKLFNAAVPCSPALRRKSCFYTGLAQERDAVPAVFGGYLGEQQSGVAATADDQTVPSDDDLFGVADDLDWPHDGDLIAEVWQFLPADGVKRGSRKAAETALDETAR